MRIQLEKLQKIYHKGTDYAVEALKSVDLTVEEGECLAIMGVSGSGKSTLLNILGFTDKPTDGRYLIDGEAAVNLDEYVMRNRYIGFILQNYGLLGNKTVYENVAFPLLIGNEVKFRDIRAKVNKALETVGISELSHRKADHISGGQRQRTAIARALVTNPELILADEPTAALDSKTADEVMEVLLKLGKMGKTVIVVTHDLRIAEKCSRIIHIADGQLEEGDA